MRHVKPHGALYNDAAKDPDLAAIVVDAAGDAVVVGPPDSAIEAAVREKGAAFAAEGFVDRLYLASGALTPRSTHGAVIAKLDQRAAQARAIAKEEEFAAADGVLTLVVDTLCIHSDSPGAVETAAAVRAALEADGFALKAF